MSFHAESVLRAALGEMEEVSKRKLLLLNVDGMRYSIEPEYVLPPPVASLQRQPSRPTCRRLLIQDGSFVCSLFNKLFNPSRTGSHTQLALLHPRFYTVLDADDAGYFNLAGVEGPAFHFILKYQEGKQTVPRSLITDGSMLERVRKAATTLGHSQLLESLAAFQVSTALQPGSEFSKREESETMAAIVQSVMRSRDSALDEMRKWVRVYRNGAAWARGAHFVHRTPHARHPRPRCLPGTRCAWRRMCASSKSA